MLKKIRLYPFLFVAASIFIVYTYSGAYDFASPLQMIAPFVIEIFTTVLLYSLVYLLLREPRKTAVSVTFLVIALFFRLELSIVVVALILFMIYIRWRKGIWEWNLAEVYLKWTGVVFLVIYIILFAYLERRVPFGKIQALAKEPIITGHSISKPDIYYIILDGYGSVDSLRNYFGYDNQEFISWLEGRGFYIASDAKANYPRTILSLDSSLNMDYLDHYTAVMGDTGYWWPIMDTLHHSRLRTFLEAQGYRSVFIDSGWDYTSIQDGNKFLSAYSLALTEFEDVWIRQTNLKVLSLLPEFGLPWPTFATHRQITNYAFDALGSIAGEQGPKFVYVHIIAPHPPFVFNQDGGPVNPSYAYTLFDGSDFPGSLSDYKQGYIAQLIYVNHRMRATIDAILTHSKTSPIIIVQGDHGPGMYTDFTSAQNTCLNERFSILNAYHLPGDVLIEIKLETTPVNSFRLILDAYFGTGLGVLPDRQYFSPRDQLFQFQDVTQESKRICEIK